MRVSSYEKQIRALVACSLDSLEQCARHTETVNLYAPLTLPSEQAHVVDTTTSSGPAGGSRRSDVHTMFTVRI